jgi:hypothetical protein
MNKTNDAELYKPEIESDDESENSLGRDVRVKRTWGAKGADPVSEVEAAPADLICCEKKPTQIWLDAGCREADNHFHTAPKKDRC